MKYFLNYVLGHIWQQQSQFPTITKKTTKIAHVEPFKLQSIATIAFQNQPNPLFFTDMNRLKQTLMEVAQELSVSAQTLEIYGDLDFSLSFQVNFTGELRADLRGLTKDIFACFWTALESYFYGENSKVPYLSISERHTARDIFPVIGKHAKLAATLPCDRCRSVLLWMCSADDVDEELLPEDYLLSEAERHLFRDCLKQERGRKQREEERFSSTRHIR